MAMMRGYIGWMARLTLQCRARPDSVQAAELLLPQVAVLPCLLGIWQRLLGHWAIDMGRLAVRYDPLDAGLGSDSIAKSERFETS
jgi:hypothetical protein